MTGPLGVTSEPFGSSGLISQDCLVVKRDNDHLRCRVSNAGWAPALEKAIRGLGLGRFEPAEGKRDGQKDGNADRCEQRNYEPAALAPRHGLALSPALDACDGLRRKATNSVMS